MKSKTNQLTLIYIITAVFGYRFSQTVPKVFSYSGLPVLYFLERPYFVFYWYYFRYILSANDNRNRVILKTQEKQWRNQGVKWKIWYCS
jgi:hypothetical protein